MYVGRNAATIRDQLLAFWSIQYAAAGIPLLTAPGSDAYIQAAAFATQLEGLEAQAEQTARDIFPDTASTPALDHHGEVDGVPRLGASVASFNSTVTNAVDGTKTIPVGTRATFADGTAYAVQDPTVVISSGTGTIALKAVLPGSAGSRSVGQVLTFVSAPVGLDPTMTVSGTPTPGNDAEGDAAYAARIILARQERPGSGNRADWKQWTESYQGTQIAEAFVYPLLEPPASYPGAGTPQIPGCVTVVAVGPAQGDSLTNRRIVPTDDISTRTAGALLPKIVGFIEGTNTATGTATTAGAQLRPVTMAPGDYSVEAISSGTTANVQLTCVMDTANAFPWIGSVTIASSTTTTIVAAGDHTAINSKPALVFVGTGVIRGGYQAVTMPLGVYSAGNTTWTFSAALLAAPVATTNVIPAPPNWDAICTAVFQFFDALAPGDTTPPSRWPAPSTSAQATFYPSALEAALVQTLQVVVVNGVSTPILTGVPGILSAQCTAPGILTPAAKVVIALESLTVTA